MMRIENAVIRTILSVESAVASACKMFQPHRGNCFGLYYIILLLYYLRVDITMSQITL